MAPPSLLAFATTPESSERPERGCSVTRSILAIARGRTTQCSSRPESTAGSIPGVGHIAGAALAAATAAAAILVSPRITAALTRICALRLIAKLHTAETARPTAGALIPHNSVHEIATGTAVTLTVHPVLTHTVTLGSTADCGGSGAIVLAPGESPQVG